MEVGISLNMLQQEGRSDASVLRNHPAPTNRIVQHSLRRKPGRSRRFGDGLSRGEMGLDQKPLQVL